MIYLENESLEDFERVTITNDLLMLKGSLLTNILDAETGQRGFLLTSNNDYLEPFNRGVADANLNLKMLQQLTRSDKTQQDMLLQIEKLMSQKFSELQSTIDLHYAKRFDESLAIVNSDKGKLFMDEIRSRLQTFNNNLIQKRTLQKLDFINLQESIRLFFILESIFFAIVLLLIASIVSKTILKPIHNLTTSVKAFEIDKQFIPVQVNTGDEIGILSKAFNKMAQKATFKSRNLQGDFKRVKQERDKALVESISDPLTGLSNRKFMEVELNKLIQSSKRYGTDLSLMILDLDHFKQVNDYYGHVVGDIVLKAVSKVIKQAMRASDLTIRYGGEEFIVVMDHTSSDEAAIKAEILRQQIENLEIDELKGKNITISIGVTQLDQEDTSLESFVARADEALYKAKNLGRNQCQLI
ncbi:diguanylate cyclase [Pseudoalteromonas sp.]|uniref:diguanylate cyclase n=1 Tax=Pseudoalteromonas sp. TaxID=53249 RepID=UPI0035655F00